MSLKELSQTIEGNMKMNNSPLLSIVIPTRNRQTYCIEAVNNILKYRKNCFELCIQDNSDSDEIEVYIKKLKDERIKFNRVRSQIASIFNINNSIDLATGKYVIMIGDDDTILPEIFEAVEWANDNNIESVCPTVNVEYFWPGVIRGEAGGTVVLPYFNGSVHYLDVARNLTKLFENGIINYQKYMLPKVYHGIVLLRKLKEIKAISGNYFTGLSPDISGCIALSSVIQKHVVIDYPISIAGACPESTTAKSLNSSHSGELIAAPHFYLRGPYDWNEMVPRFYSVETIWADSALSAAKLVNRSDLLDVFNYQKLACFAVMKNKSIFRFAILEVMNNGRYSIGIVKIITLTIQIIFEKIVNKIKSTSKRKYTNIKNVNNIDEAVLMYNLRN